MRTTNDEKCPNCGKERLDFDSIDVQSDRAYQKISCDCGFDGDDVYVYSHTIDGWGQRI